jgi:hypothetical protein
MNISEETRRMLQEEETVPTKEQIDEVCQAVKEEYDRVCRDVLPIALAAVKGTQNANRISVGRGRY